MQDMGRRTNLAWCWAGAGIVLGCDLQRRPADRLSESTEDLPILASVSGAYSNLRRETRLAVYEQGVLNQLPMQVRPVDFTREMVLFAALGPTPSAAYGIAIPRVERRGRRIHVQVVKTYPPPEQGLAAAPASPFCIVVVPRSDLPVTGFDSRWPPQAFAGAKK